MIIDEIKNFCMLSNFLFSLSQELKKGVRTIKMVFVE